MNTDYNSTENNNEQEVPHRNFPLINPKADYIYYWMPSGFKRKGTFLMQLDDPGFSGVIFCFQHNEEEKRREFLAGVTDTRLLGKASGYRVYCVIFLRPASPSFFSCSNAGMTYAPNCMMMDAEI